MRHIDIFSFQNLLQQASISFHHEWNQRTSNFSTPLKLPRVFLKIVFRPSATQELRS